MRLAIAVAILLVCAALINGIAGDLSIPLPRLLPFMGGPDRPAGYNYGGLALVVITLWGLWRLYGRTPE